MSTEERRRRGDIYQVGVETGKGRGEHRSQHAGSYVSPSQQRRKKIKSSGKKQQRKTQRGKRVEVIS